MFPPAVGVFCSTTDIRRSIGPTSWRKDLLVSAAPSEGGRPIRGGSSGERGRGDNGGRPRVGRARRPPGVALRLQSAGPGDGQQGVLPPRDHVSPNLSQQTAESGLTTHAGRELILW